MRKSTEGYFQFSIEQDGIYLTVYPPVDNGQKVRLEDILFYIDKKKIQVSDITILKDIAESKDILKVKVSDEKVNPTGEFGQYKVSSDNCHVWAVFYPPFEGASELTYNEITGDLKNLGINAGINENVIKDFIDNKKYGYEYEVASAVMPEEGKDGYIEYKFNSSLKPAPKVKDDGTVDFHSLENVNRIKKGDVVAILHPADPGNDGVDVHGRAIHPSRVKRAVFRYNRNLKVSDDGLQLISLVDGHVILENEKIVASNVMELINVDNSTGDIEYDGNLSIKGNVLAGFSVRATGDISINGIVEGAVVQAGGNIVLNRGVQGMTKASIKAGGNIVSKFIESAQLVQAGGYIETDSILHSKVNAKGYIKVQGRNGLIIGGDVRSMVLVSAKVIGNEMGTVTTVGVGMDPASKSRIDELNKELLRMGSNKMQLDQIATALRKLREANGKLPEDKVELQQKTMRNLIILEKQIGEYKKEYAELKSQLSEDSNARIKVYDSVNVGVKLVFGEQCFFIQSKHEHCQFAKERGTIKSLLL